MTENGGGDGKEKKGYIKIPSYEEVLGSYQSKQPPSLFTPSSSPSSSSFSQAFSFIKSSEFYTPPPPPPVASSSSSSSDLASASATPAAAAAAGSTSSSSLSPYPSSQNRNAILVSHRQDNIWGVFNLSMYTLRRKEILCLSIFEMSGGCLQMSLRYHLLHPEYLYFRIRELQKTFKLRVVLCHIDVEDVVKPLQEVTRTALLHDCTLLCAWSLEECGRYLETIKVYENKPADSIQERMDTDYMSRLNHALTAVRHVNKSDVVTLGSAFGSLSHIMDASMEDLARCPGIGERKVKRLYDTFHEPFRRDAPKPPVTLEASLQDKGKLVSEDKDSMEAGEQNPDGATKNEPSMTVRSALSAAFAKYKDKINKQDVKSSPVDKNEGTAAGISEMELANRPTGQEETTDI
ncbi:hypothetical protein ACLOJK_004955 [Asimina triloba]